MNRSFLGVVSDLWGFPYHIGRFYSLRISEIENIMLNFFKVTLTFSSKSKGSSEETEGYNSVSE